MRGKGQALPVAARKEVESQFGVDFGQVRLHTSIEAAEVTRDVGAQAFTLGRDVFFGHGKYAPETRVGRKLLAHELTHTIQQDAAARSGSTPAIMRTPQEGGAEAKTPGLGLLGPGTPEPLVVRSDGNVLATVYFEKDSILLDANNLKAVESLAEELSVMPDATVTVDGHASTEGEPGYNKSLSEMRRFGVVALLSSKLVKSRSFEGKGYGEAKPAMAEDAKEATALEAQRKQNRRAEILILSGPAETPKKKLDFSVPFREETLEERVARIIKEASPAPAEKESISELVWKKVDELIDRHVPRKLRGLAKKGARKLSEKVFDSVLDEMGVKGDAKEAIKAAMRASGQTIKP
jgi:outer membrane protein OmpA-like peptidoglycan-associated protein